MGLAIFNDTIRFGEVTSLDDVGFHLSGRGLLRRRIVDFENSSAFDFRHAQLLQHLTRLRQRIDFVGRSVDLKKKKIFFKILIRNWKLAYLAFREQLDQILQLLDRTAIDAHHSQTMFRHQFHGQLYVQARQASDKQHARLKKNLLKL